MNWIEIGVVAAVGFTTAAVGAVRAARSQAERVRIRVGDKWIDVDADATKAQLRGAVDEVIEALRHREEAVKRVTDAATRSDGHDAPVYAAAGGERY